MEFRDEDEEFSAEALAVMDRYEEKFGEAVPFGLMLVPIEEIFLPILRQCLDEGSTDPIGRQFPPGVVI